MKITLDTNVLQEYWKKQSKRRIVEQLILLANEGQIDLAVTARIHDDIPSDPLAKKINSLPEIGVTMTGSVTRLGYWVLGQDMLGDQAMSDYWENIAQNTSEKGNIPDFRDQDHIHAHYLLNRDVFLTWDKGIIKLADDLENKFGIIIMTPEEFFRSSKEF